MRAGSSGIFLCELGRHGIVLEERETLPFGKPEPDFKNDTSIIGNCNTFTISY
jgi:hypothetical protein